ncbi:MAG: ABC transporter permease [Kiritimatiellia bacterium]
MRNIFQILRRQFLAYFRSPLGYVVAAVFYFVAGLSFCRLLAQSATDSLRIGDLLFGSAYFWLGLLAAIVLVTMALFAEERHSGTFETLMTAPVTDVQVVLAKFLAAYMFLVFMLAPTLLYAGILHAYNAAGAPLALKPVACGWMIVLLIASFYTAFGLLMSSLTGSAAAAAVLCCLGMGVTFLGESLQHALRSTMVERTVAQISSIQHVLDFSRGVIDTQPVYFYISGTILFLYLAVKSVESRLWR